MTTDLGTESFSDASLLAPVLNQPIPVEGSDPSLATVILPAPPPLGFVRLPMNKRPGDHAKRPLPSFIPHSDPSSTYATHHPPTSIAITTSVGISDPDIARPKRSRAEKTPVVVVRPPRSYPSQTTGPSPDSPPRSNIPFDPALSAPLNIPLASSPSHATSVLLRLPESSIDQPMLEPTSPHLEYLSLSDAQYQSENSSSEPPAKRQRGRPRKYPNAPVQVDSSGTPRPLVTISPPASAHSQLSHSIITLNAAPGPSETKTPPGTLVLNFRREQRESRQKPASSIASARLETAPVAVPSSSTSNPAVPKDIGATAGFHTNGPYTFRNDDICACCSTPHSESTSSPLSHFLYCDGCTRSFHMGCLDPPIIDASDQPPSDNDWFCPSCIADRASLNPLPANAGPFDYLANSLETMIPKVFQLPEDIRGFFKAVSTGRHGAFVDSGNTKAGKADRHGYLEDRDPTRIKDRNNKFITCYRCGQTALPRQPPIDDTSLPPAPSNSKPSSSSAVTPLPQSPLDVGSASSTASVSGAEQLATSSSAANARRLERNAHMSAEVGLGAVRIISCDCCSAHWHLDCLDPPMVQMPSPLKKWMCPNHIEHVMPKRRTAKQIKVIDVRERHIHNNGYIDVIPSAEEMGPDADRRYEEVWINSRKYTVPERTIRLDFLDKVIAKRKQEDSWRKRVLRHLADDSSTSSSLTELTSSSDAEGSDEDDSQSDDQSDESIDESRLRQDLEEVYVKSDAALSLLSIYDRRLSMGGHPIPDFSMEALVHTALAEIFSLRPSTDYSRPSSSHLSAPTSSYNDALSPPHLTSTSPVKAGSTATSFRIRLNKPRSILGRDPVASPSTSLIIPPRPLTAPSDRTVTVETPTNEIGDVKSNDVVNGNEAPQTQDQPSLSPEEIQQLLQVRDLMRIKGEKKLMEFLSSP